MAPAPDAEERPRAEGVLRSTTTTEPRSSATRRGRIHEPYTQPFNNVMLAMLENLRLSHFDTRFLSWLVYAVDPGTMRCTGITVTSLAEVFGVGRNTMQNALEKLKGEGFITYDFERRRTGWVELSAYDRIVRWSAHLAEQRRKAGIAKSQANRARSARQPADNALSERDSTGETPNSFLNLSGEPHDDGEAVAVVIDLDEARENTSIALSVRASASRHSLANDEPSRVVAVARRALREHPHPPGRMVQPREDSSCHDSAGGGNDPAPVHPRSLKQTLTSPLRTTEPLRNPRAMSPDTASPDTASGEAASGEAASGFSRWA